MARRGWASSRSLEGKRSAQASVMEAEGARRHRRLDAQHDSATGIAGDARMPSMPKHQDS